MHFDLIELIKTFGYLGVFGILFAESGLFVGFFLPGDSLLFTAGFLASQGFLNIQVLTIGGFISSVAGVAVGYAFGQKFGKRLFNRPNSLLFHKDNLLKAQEFYKKHGGLAIILTRFMPIIRTFVPIAAGIADMPYPSFMLFTIIASLIWAVGLSLAGFLLGNSIPNVDHYLLPIIVLIIIISILPSLVHILKQPTHRKQLFSLLKKLLPA